MQLLLSSFSLNCRADLCATLEKNKNNNKKNMRAKEGDEQSWRKKKQHHTTFIITPCLCLKAHMVFHNVIVEQIKQSQINTDSPCYILMTISKAFQGKEKQSRWISTEPLPEIVKSTKNKNDCRRTTEQAQVVHTLCTSTLNTCLLGARHSSAQDGIDLFLKCTPQTPYKQEMSVMTQIGGIWAGKSLANMCTDLHKACPAILCQRCKSVGHIKYTTKRTGNPAVTCHKIKCKVNSRKSLPKELEEKTP